MAIIIYGGVRMVGLSTDTKPESNNGITFYETDTGYEYLRTGGTWMRNPNYLLTGMIVLDAGLAIPDGFLLCDGSAVSRTTYDNLFGAIGTTYGSGDGSTTFNLPNLKGKVAVGQDTGQTEFDVLGETGGVKTHTLTESEMPSHTHGFTNLRGLGTGSQTTGYSGITAGNDTSSTATPVITASTGSGSSHQNLQPYIVLNYLIKT